MECYKCRNIWDSELHIPRILSCGHTFCEICMRKNFKLCQIQCEACQKVHIFSIDRQFDDTDSAYIEKCISSMSKNFTLLSLTSARPSLPELLPSKSQEFEFPMCEEHNLPLHSFTEKPDSNLCDKCIEEIADLGLEIKPIREVSEYFSNTIEEISRNLAKQRKDCEILMVNSNSEKNKLESAESELSSYFARFKLTLEEVSVAFAKQLEQAVYDQFQINLVSKESSELAQELLKELEGNLRYFEELNDADLSKCSEALMLLLEKSNSKQRRSESTYLSLHTNKAILSSIKELFNSSYEISVKTFANSWQCPCCQSNNIYGLVTCTTCNTFRPLESYPNLLTDPENATVQEIYELNVRRDIELQTIRELDNDEKKNVYYLIHSDWIKKWKEFIFNKSEDNKIGARVLPPGPISNHLLFSDLECKKLKPKLRAAIDYRGLSDKVWQVYYQTYGGGPIIVRKKLNIYDEAKKV